MSALGHKQTYAPHQVMSALPPIATAKADISWRFSEASPWDGGRAIRPTKQPEPYGRVSTARILTLRQC
jgi:hypothetical protein